ncbi:CaiB/BaiF CoA transferase family protein [Mycolicibacterium komossense]|uniref:CoA transferase n=1 Tax=Mycolicibacterium komossense TaxID=1779 RepID=A0ABT3CAI6_9MYCO|nr:CaiB/BaiF CoA-transferase family protein [Mycolicibacterium komossense]MCV7226495.1 CoA transferase [Mycolicibacterium komossense]
MTTPLPAPLHGVRVLEVGGMGPGPFAGMTLADMGAEVVRIDRPGGPGVFPGDPTQDLLNRGKRSVCLDLKRPAAVEIVLAMAAHADILIEGHRPAVAERLGIGPADCHARNPALVYGRMTGWGQDGPLANRAGHDVSYIALTGALHAIGDASGPPQIPLNIVGDFGGGATYLVMGVLAALWEAGRTGKGRTVDAAIIDGAAHLLSATHAMLNTGTWRDERGVNMLDGGAPYYAVYATADGEHMAVGAIESKFYRLLLAGLGLHDVDTALQDDRSTWPRTRERIAAAFRANTRAHWTEVFEPTDACVAPVMSLREAAEHPHLKARGTVVEHNGVLQAAPAPRFSGTPAAVGTAPVPLGADTRAVLAEWGIAEDLIASATASQPNSC